MLIAEVAFLALDYQSYEDLTPHTHLSCRDAFPSHWIPRALFPLESHRDLKELSVEVLEISQLETKEHLPIGVREFPIALLLRSLHWSLKETGEISICVLRSSSHWNLTEIFLIELPGKISTM